MDMTERFKVCEDTGFEWHWDDDHDDWLVDEDFNRVLSHICICHAFNEHECVCGAWERPVQDYDKAMLAEEKFIQEELEAFTENVLLEGDPFKIDAYYKGKHEIDYNDVGGYR